MIASTKSRDTNQAKSAGIFGVNITTRQRTFSETEMTPWQIRRLHLAAHSKLNRETRRSNRDSRVRLGHAALVGGLGEALTKCALERAASVDRRRAKRKCRNRSSSRLSREVQVSIRPLEADDIEENVVCENSSSSSEEAGIDYESDDDVVEDDFECVLLRIPSHRLQYRDFINGLSSQQRCRSPKNDSVR